MLEGEMQILARHTYRLRNLVYVERRHRRRGKSVDGFGDPRMEKASRGLSPVKGSREHLVSKASGNPRALLQHGNFDAVKNVRRRISLAVEEKEFGPPRERAVSRTSSSSSSSSGVVIPRDPAPLVLTVPYRATKPTLTYHDLCHLFEDGREEAGQGAEYFQPSHVIYATLTLVLVSNRQKHGLNHFHVI